jgi:signal transduction histidine kinase
VVKWLGMNVDITARKNAEHGLTEADRQKSEFISVLAHELRNPLAPLRSSVDVLVDESATSVSKARAVSMIDRQTTHLTRLVEALSTPRASRLASSR